MAGLHDRSGGGAVEIGYWCHVDHLGRGVATRAARALTALPAGLPTVDRVEIHCDEANLRSAAVARRLGYRLDRVEAAGVRAPGSRAAAWSGCGTARAAPPPERGGHWRALAGTGGR